MPRKSDSGWSTSDSLLAGIIGVLAAVWIGENGLDTHGWILIGLLGVAIYIRLFSGSGRRSRRTRSESETRTRQPVRGAPRKAQRARRDPSGPGLEQTLAGILSSWWEQRQRNVREQKRRTIGDLMMMTPAEFEEEMADLLCLMGYQDVEVMGRSGDRGIDIEAREPTGPLVIAQCKKFGGGGKVSGPEIQSFLGAMMLRRDVRYGIFFTTAEFTPQALDMAHSSRVVPVDGAGLMELIEAVENGADEADPRELLTVHSATKVRD